jgi:hypothetical protein
MHDADLEAILAETTRIRVANKFLADYFDAEWESSMVFFDREELLKRQGLAEAAAFAHQQGVEILNNAVRVLKAAASSAPALPAPPTPQAMIAAPKKRGRPPKVRPEVPQLPEPSTNGEPH